MRAPVVRAEWIPRSAYRPAGREDAAGLSINVLAFPHGAGGVAWSA